MEAFIPALLLIFLAVFARVQQGSWLAPGAFFALIWSIFVFAPLILAPDFYMWSGAIWWILFVAFAVYVGSILGSGRGFSKLIPYFSRDKTNKLKFPWIRKIIFICTLLGLGAVIITLHSRGYNIFSLFSLDSIQQMGQDFSFARYHEGYSPPLLATFFSTFIYFI